MADFKINGVTFASESSGVITLSESNILPPNTIVQTHQHAYTDNTVIGGSVNTFLEITQATTSITTKRANASRACSRGNEHRASL